MNAVNHLIILIIFLIIIKEIQTEMLLIFTKIKIIFLYAETILKKRLLILEIIFFIMSRTLILFLIEMRQQYILITTEIMILIIHLIT